MVVEHVFVTTLDAPDALRLASEFLTAGGFAVEGQTAFQLGGWTRLEMTRGKQNAAAAKSIEQLPQRIKVEWDRGRVTVAAYIHAHVRASFSFGTGAELPANSAKARPHAQLLTAIAQGLELLLAHGRPAAEAAAGWQAVSGVISAEAARRRRRGWITLAVVLVLFALLIGFAVWANTR